MSEQDEEDLQLGPPQAQGDNAGSDRGNQQEGQRGQRQGGGLGYKGIVDRGQDRGGKFLMDAVDEQLSEQRGIEQRYGWIGRLLNGQQWNDEQESARRGNAAESARLLGEWMSDGLISLHPSIRDVDLSQWGQQGEMPAILSDVEVAGILVAFNKAELDHLQFAVDNGQHELVNGFAQDLLVHHTDALARQAELFEYHDIKPVDSNQGITFVAAMTDLQEGWINAQGGELDLLFMESQIKIHFAALDLVDVMLLPVVKNEALIAELQRVRIATAHHLDRAQLVRHDLGGEGLAERQQ